LEKVVLLLPELVVADEGVKEDVRGGESVATAFGKHRK
jgi:hypothetical protein